MRNKIIAGFAAVVGVLSLSAPAQADGVLAIGGGVSTLGYGVHVATEVNDFIVLRANGNFGDFDVPDFGLLGSNLGGLDYDIDAEMGTYGLLVDFHPLGLSPIGSGLVLTGGVYYNNNEFSLTSDLVAEDVGSATITGRVVSTMSFDQKFAPYLGMGYDGTFQGIIPVSFFMTGGVLFQGSPSVSVWESTSTVSQADLDAEAQQLEDSASSFKYYPVLAVGVSISF